MLTVGFKEIQASSLSARADYEFVLIIPDPQKELIPGTKRKDAGKSVLFVLVSKIFKISSYDRSFQERL